MTPIVITLGVVNQSLISDVLMKRQPTCVGLLLSFKEVGRCGDVITRIPDTENDTIDMLFALRPKLHYSNLLYRTYAKVIQQI